ncbi:hypothetical protein CMV_013504 [Castanea mollissima]|uniref:Uncharacterized protein n=1 Tax=Castanea mollissima TaxID=60419 RepID=A0A8J4VUW5_9ROSI|nr:hypothetical protein CMV_013504 [Castanea mollissima]
MLVLLTLEYIVHLGLPTLGGNLVSNDSLAPILNENSNSEALAPSDSNNADPRSQVRWQSYAEMRIFEKRWANASKEDSCWIDPYQ